jgi:hypothetical protein
MAVLAQPPVVAEATPVGALSAQMRRPPSSSLPKRRSVSDTTRVLGGAVGYVVVKKQGGVAEFCGDLLAAFLDVGNRDPRALGHKQPCLGFPLPAFASCTRR